MDKLPFMNRIVLECGRPFRRPPGPQLMMTGHFPAVVEGGTSTLVGSVVVSATGGPATGVVTPLVDVFLVRGGKVATLPMPQDLIGVPLRLESGDTRSLPGQVSLRACSAADESGAAAGRLTPGHYQIWARLIVNRKDGTQVESVGGPWPLEVR